MKRHPCLVPLSDDHHRALVLARRLLRCGSAPEELDSLESESRRAFEAELEPHFQVEERWLVPALDRAGATRLTERLRSDHDRIRRLVGDAWTRDAAQALGALLERHVRFEERVLFPEAERLLSQAELEAVRVARLDAVPS